MSKMKRSTALLAIVTVVTVAASLAPAAATAAPTTQRETSSIVGQGTWFLGSASVNCDRDTRPTSVFEFVDQCTYRADSAPSEAEPDDGCFEFSDGAIVGGCRAALQGATTTRSRLADVCTQAALLNGNAGYPIGPPDGQVTVHSTALNKSFAVPVIITVNGAVGKIFGSRRVDSGPVGQIVVEGQFLWNLKGEQGCPVQGTEPTTGLWHGTYTFFSNAL